MSKTKLDIDECPVCWEPLGGRTRKRVECMCGYTVCMECVKKNLLTSMETPKCIECKVEWTLRFLLTVLPKGWVNGTKPGQLRHYQKTLIIEREKAKIPEYLELIRIKEELAEIEKEKRRVCCEVGLLLETLEKHHVKLKKWENKDLIIDDQLATIYRKAGINEQREITAKKAIKFHEDPYLNNTRTNKLFDKTEILQQEYMDIMEGQTKKSSPSKRGYEYVCSCPAKNCRGLISKIDHTCVICKVVICEKCREPTAEKHKCDPETIKTVVLIKNETKPCPKCATIIQKTEGCDQMWCIGCQTAFSWERGTIETGIIHNPHAMEWMRNHTTYTPIDNCDNLISYKAFFRKEFNSLDTDNSSTFNLMYRRVAECGAIDPNNVTDLKIKTKAIEYLKGYKTEKKWQQTVFNAERRIKRIKKLAEILATFYTLGKDQFRIFYENGLKNKPDVNTFYNEMEELRIFINQTIDSELSVLGSKNTAEYHIKWENYIYNCFVLNIY